MSTNPQAVDQDQWLTIEQASQLVERSQIAIRAFVQTTLEENEHANLLRPHESDDRPFSYLIHRSLLEKEFNLGQENNREEVEGLKSTGTDELAPQIEKLQATINDQAQRISLLEANLLNSSKKEIAQISSDPETIKEQAEPSKDWLDQAIDQKAKKGINNERELSKKDKPGSSMGYLWAALLIVTLLALGAGYLVLQKLDKLPF